MRRRTVATIAVGATASLVVGGIAVAQVAPGARPMLGRGPMGGGMMGMMAGKGMMGAGDVDRRFIEEMIPHHDDAVVMADLAPNQAEHAELKALAHQIRTTQTHEINQMRAWHEAWYSTADVPPGRMDQMHETMGGMMGGIMGAGSPMHSEPSAIDGAKPFDRAFIEHMVPHHRMAVMMSNMALGGAAQPKLRQLLQSIITSQSDEIAQMRSWYRAWYG